MIKYRDIKNLEDLDKAQQQLHSKLRKKEKRISKNFDGVKDSFTPMNLFASGLHKVSTDIPFDVHLLNIVRKLKKRLGSK